MQEMNGLICQSLFQKNLSHHEHDGDARLVTSFCDERAHRNSQHGNVLESTVVDAIVRGLLRRHLPIHSEMPS